MKRYVLLALLAAPVFVVLAVLLAPAPALAATSGVRGIVVDEHGQPLADVEVEIEFMGKPKAVYHLKTNKKGGFVRIGLVEGSYKIYLTKPGFKKYGIDTYLSLATVSDMCSNHPGPNDPCQDLIMKTAEVAVSIGGEPAGAAGAAQPGQAAQPGTPGAGAPGAGAATATAEEAARLGAAYTRAVEAIKTQQWDVAEEALKEVLVKVPDQPVVHFNLGHVYRQKKDWASAEAEFKRVTELEPAKPDAFVALAALYEAQGKGDLAVEWLQKNAATFDQNAAYQVALGATAMNQGHEKEAEVAFSKAATLDPSNVEVQFYLATLALNRNETADAIAHLDKYLAGAPPTSPNVEVATNLLAALKAKK
jgi:cytochrome c-type biogenesis protein CcmH/NrfG